MEVKLINFMKQNNFVHNINNPNYYNAPAKDKKWREIANKLGKDVKTVKKRWRTLRDKFHREDQLIRMTGSGLNTKGKWKYYDNMIFVRESKKPPPNSTSKPKQTNHFELMQAERKISKQIISFVKNNDFLYNTNSLEYKNKKAKDDKWLHLSLLLGLTVEETKRRWDILKKEFYKEEKRLYDEDCAWINYEYYKSLKFLRQNKNTSTKSISHTESNLTEEEIVRNIIDFVKKNNLIDCKNENKELEANEEKWQELADRLELNVTQIKEKWETLKKIFYQEYGNNKYISKWEYFNDLKFLADSKNFKKNVNRFHENLFEEIMIDDEDDNIYEPNHDEIDEPNICEDSSNTPEQSNGSSLHEENISHEKDFTKSIKSAFGRKMSLAERDNILEKSAIMSFFESIAFTIANAKLPTSEILFLQMKILKLITKRITTYECKNS